MYNNLFSTKVTKVFCLFNSKMMMIFGCKMCNSYIFFFKIKCMINFVSHRSNYFILFYFVNIIIIILGSHTFQIT